MVTMVEIKAGLEALGLRTASQVFLHSSLSSLGYVDGGPDSVIDSIMEIISGRGTLMAPTFTYNTIVFDPLTTPSKTGLITETLRLRAGTVRSWHPTHSVAALGAEAEQLTANHEIAFGTGSPIDRLASQNGYILLLGVTCRYCSAIHVAENHARVPYLGLVGNPIQEAIIKTPDGGEIKAILKNQPACGKAFGKLEPVLRERGLIKEKRIGQAHCQLIRARDMISMAVALLRKDSGALLCNQRDCIHCPQATNIIRHATSKGC